MEDHSKSGICPNCRRRKAELHRRTELEHKVEEIENTTQWIHQQLIALTHSNEEAALLSYVDQYPEAPDGYLRLGYYYLAYWEIWHEKLPLGSHKNDLQKKLLQRSVELAEKQRWLLNEGCSQVLEALYDMAAEAISELARESFQRGIALKPDPLQEAKAHKQIARMWLDSRLGLSVQDCLVSDSRFAMIYPSFSSEYEEMIRRQSGKAIRARRRENEKKARAALRAAIKAAEQHLRTNPHNVEMLQLLEFAYQTLDKPDELYEVRVRMEGTAALARAVGLRQSANEKPHQAGPNSGIPFEKKCLQILQGMGFTVSSTASTNDGGIDIIATHRGPIVGGKYVVQCKDWTNKVGVAVVRELYGVVTAEGANKGILMTSSTFTRGAGAFAQGKPLELIDGKQLAQLARERLEETGDDDGGA
jgi:HJR/Mrr/RecB family endonuclease